MVHIFENTKRKVRDWAVRTAESSHARIWLAVISFTESSFFPIPADFFLVAILLAKQHLRWAYYALVTTISSVAGGILGYFIGFYLYDTVGRALVEFYNLEHFVERVGLMFEENAFWAIFIAGFTPIPYKIFTISAGFFGISLITFIIASIISRGLRFFLVAYITRLVGEHVVHIVFKHLNLFTFLLGAAIIIFILFFR